MKALGLHILVVDYHSAVRRNEMLTHGALRMDLDSIMLSEENSHRDRMPCNSIYRKYLEQAKLERLTVKQWLPLGERKMLSDD